MAAYMRIAGVMIAGITLLGCATTKPPTQAAAANDPSCLTGTGSRIAPAPGQCRGVGRSYSNQDIDRTGQTSAGNALGLLDSSITVHH
ncbi:MAG TPA: hypothetical protein VN815_04575 [Steroidobacteraceae bacterium]|nr:hypothetical protein [Steroidobacteraceae bacterium]